MSSISKGYEEYDRARKRGQKEFAARRAHGENGYIPVLNAKREGPVGRTLDFLAQEMLRETNTIASKSPDAAISRAAVEVKGAIDRIKEQAQNVE